MVYLKIFIYLSASGLSWYMVQELAGLSSYGARAYLLWACGIFGSTEQDEHIKHAKVCNHWTTEVPTIVFKQKHAALKSSSLKTLSCIRFCFI